jgi:beta-phosphoglucomutase-like phosphatase (HAD superfamily)
MQFGISTGMAGCGAQRGMKLVIFDCDGVLIDSEALCDRIVAACLARDGWALTPAECHRRFLGLTFPDIQAAAEAWLGRPLGDHWVADVVERVTAAMAAEVEPIQGAREALLGVADLGLPYRIASNSSRPEMAAKFARTGLLPLVEGRIHSAYDLIARGKRGKPDPDLFLEAAGETAPTDCLVIEDSLAGVRGAVAAGMRCWAYCPEGDGATLRDAGALPFPSMFALPGLIRHSLGVGA